MASKIYPFKIGDRVAFKHDWTCGTAPFFTIEAGTQGEVVQCLLFGEGRHIHVRLDETVPDLAEYDNCVYFDEDIDTFNYASETLLKLRGLPTHKAMPDHYRAYELAQNTILDELNSNHGSLDISLLKDSKYFFNLFARELAANLGIGESDAIDGLNDAINE